jgi:hypothetical protein
VSSALPKVQQPLEKKEGLKWLLRVTLYLTCTLHLTVCTYCPLKLCSLIWHFRQWTYRFLAVYVSCNEVVNDLSSIDHVN